MLLLSQAKVRSVGFLVILATLAVFLWCSFPFIWIQILKLQREMIDALSEYLVFISQGDTFFAGYLLIFSFLYGLLHSASPGHGKTAVTSLSLIRNYRSRTAVCLIVSIAMLQATSACLLFSISSVLTNYFSLQMADNIRLLTQACAILIIGLALKELVLAILRIKNHQNSEVTVRSENQNGASWMTLLLIGLRPCTGAVLVLFLANMLESLLWGIISTYTMALGTALTNSVLVLKALSLKGKVSGLSSGRHVRLKGAGVILLSGVMLLSGVVLFNFATLSGLQNFVR